MTTRYKSERLRRITSAQNALIKDFRKAFSRADASSNSCAVEGIKLIEEAIRSGLRVQSVVFSDTGAERSGRLLAQIKTQVECVVVTDQIFSGMVDTESPQGVAALVSTRESTIESMLSVSNPFLVVAAGLQDPGNLGAIIRSAEAFGANGLVLGDKTVSRFNPKVVRASAGSLFRLPCVSAKLNDALPMLRGKGIRVIGTASHKGTPIDNVDLRGGIAIVIGNEGAGMPREILGQIDELVTIPQSEKVESLNAGIAASVFLYEAARQRRSPGE